MADAPGNFSTPRDRVEQLPDAGFHLHVKNNSPAGSDAPCGPPVAPPDSPRGTVAVGQKAAHAGTTAVSGPEAELAPNGGALRSAGGVGDSPVRGTLVADGEPVVGALVRRGDGDGPDAPTVPAGSQALSTGAAGAVPSLQAKRLAALARVDEKIRRRATSIVDSALRAPELVELPDEPFDHKNPPKGWTAKQWRIAHDATNSMKSAPAYLAMAQRVVESYKKAEADRPAEPRLHAEIVQVTVNNNYSYPVRVLDED
jgi:hypothetical protein